MHIFMTGATGYIGRAVATALIERGHRVSALARSADAADRLRRHGVEPTSGDLDDPGAWAADCAEADGIIHLGFQWKEDVSATIAAERRVVEAMLQAIAGSGKAFVFASGTSVLGDTGDRVFDETTPIAPHPLDQRLDTERRVLAAQGVRGVVICAPNVYGRGDGEALFAALRHAGAGCQAIPFVTGSGDHLWSFVHVDDLADMFALAVECAEPHQLFFAGAEAGLRTRDIARALSRGSGWEGRARELPLDEMRHLFPVSALADYWSQNGQSSRGKAERHLGWSPVHADMLGDIARPAST